MIRKITKISFAVAILSLAQAALAVGSGMYVGGMFGSSNTHNLKMNVITPSSGSVPTDPSNTGFGLGLLAGYNYNQYFAIEGGYIHFAPSTYKPNTGHATDPNPEIKTDAIDFALKGILPIASSGVGVFAKLGLAIVKTSKGQSLVQPQTNANATYTRPLMAVGISYDLTQNWVTDLSWTQITKGGAFQNADLIALGFSYHFTDKYCGQFLC